MTPSEPSDRQTDSFQEAKPLDRSFGILRTRRMKSTDTIRKKHSHESMIGRQRRPIDSQEPNKRVADKAEHKFKATSYASLRLLVFKDDGRFFLGFRLPFRNRFECCLRHLFKGF